MARKWRAVLGKLLNGNIFDVGGGVSLMPGPKTAFHFARAERGYGASTATRQGLQFVLAETFLSAFAVLTWLIAAASFKDTDVLRQPFQSPR